MVCTDHHNFPDVAPALFASTFLLHVTLSMRITDSMPITPSEQAGNSCWDFEAALGSEAGQQRVVLGVDGGATCTVCVCSPAPLSVLDEPLAILSRVVTASSNYNSVGEMAARRAVEESMAGALMKAQAPRSAVLSVCLALAGIDRPSDVQAYLPWIRKIFEGDVKIFVQNDAVAALASGTAGRLYGCVVVAGTGTIALGFGEDGKFARASGVGPLLGDQGSGYAIASQALTAVMRAHDGRGPSTTLTETILKALDLASAEDLIGWAYADSAWARIAALVPLVKACAGDGDLVARKVLDDAVYELACSVKAVVHTLKLSGRDGKRSFPCVMVGGVLENENGWDLCKPLIQKIIEMLPGAQPIRPKDTFKLGAVGYETYIALARRDEELNNEEDMGLCRTDICCLDDEDASAFYLVMPTDFELHLPVQQPLYPTEGCKVEPAIGAVMLACRRYQSNLAMTSEGGPGPP